MDEEVGSALDFWLPELARRTEGLSMVLGGNADDLVDAHLDLSRLHVDLGLGEQVGGLEEAVAEIGWRIAVSSVHAERPAADSRDEGIPLGCSLPDSLGAQTERFRHDAESFGNGVGPGELILALLASRLGRLALLCEPEGETR